MNLDRLREDFQKEIDKLIEEGELKKGDSLILGGSSSEVIGQALGSATNSELSDCLIEAFVEKSRDHGLYPVVQACEHINRSLVVERAYAEKYDLMPINVLPVPDAGGGFASSAMKFFKDPVLVERARRIKAGIDVGDVFIAMHLDPDRVGVVVRPHKAKLGQANLTMIRTREKLIGGPRSKHY